jgi:pimeloyl-ACP methyl ester carboxylesterase
MSTVNFERYGEGVPTIVFETGWCDNLEDFRTVADELKGTSGVFLHDRPGTGKSKPRGYTVTYQDIALELRELLDLENVPKPYLLVGHSRGGLLSLMFTHLYPHDVAGLVLVDSSHPDQDVRRVQSLTPEELEVLHRGDGTELAEDDPEQMDYLASCAQMRGIRSIGDVPLTVIAAGVYEVDEANGEPDSVSKKIHAEWLEMQQDFLKLSSNSHYILAKNSHHIVQECEPELIVAAIKKHIALARNESVNGANES